MCQNCGYESPKWLGKCPGCENWATFVEFASRTTKKGIAKKASPPKYLKDIKDKKLIRLSTSMSEMDRVLGGGLIAGQVVLLAGDPGIGKSTLLMQLASGVGSALYVLGEESLSQVKTRVERMGSKAEKIAFLEETNIDVVLATLEKEINKADYKVVIVDSVQTMYSEDLTGVPGSVGQVKEVAFRLIAFAKQNDVPIILVGHVTKDGTVAGPSTLAHMVDTVLWLEGDRVSPLRVLRSIKNRFASIDEVGIFQMKNKGLVGSADVETMFLGEKRVGVAGSVISCVMEGTRPFLVEIQSLVVPTKLAIPRRVVQGLDSKRVELLIAVLMRHCGLYLSERDVFVNVVGGIKIKDPGVDLAVAFAIASSYKDKVVMANTLVIGEVGLLGEIRETAFEQKRIARAKHQGFREVINAGKFKQIASAVRGLH